MVQQKQHKLTKTSPAPWNQRLAPTFPLGLRISRRNAAEKEIKTRFGSGAGAAASLLFLVSAYYVYANKKSGFRLCVRIGVCFLSWFIRLGLNSREREDLIFLLKEKKDLRIIFIILKIKIFLYYFVGIKGKGNVKLNKRVKENSSFSFVYNFTGLLQNLFVFFFKGFDCLKLKNLNSSARDYFWSRFVDVASLLYL